MQPYLRYLSVVLYLDSRFMYNYDHCDRLIVNIPQGMGNSMGNYL
jgi:hypothetical protein